MLYFYQIINKINFKKNVIKIDIKFELSNL